MRMSGPVYKDCATPVIISNANCSVSFKTSSNLLWSLHFSKKDINVLSCQMSIEWL